MKIHPAAQGTMEWISARAGIPTASEFDALITPKGEPRKGEMPKSYLAKKLAEAWGGPLMGFSTFATEQGKILEEKVIPWLAFEYDWNIERPGLITTDDGKIGCSPDGLITVNDAQIGLELKAPEAPQHVKYLLGEAVPADYVAQVQGALFVTKLAQWRFVSYRRQFPPLIVLVSPDTMFQNNLEDALNLFLEQFAVAMGRLVEMNGGQPPPPQASTEGIRFSERSDHVFDTDENDLIP